MAGGVLAVIGGLIFVGVITFFGLAIAGSLDSSPSSDSTWAPAPQPTSRPTSYPTSQPTNDPVEVPDPDLNPPELPYPDDTAQATTWTKASLLYDESVAAPTACKIPYVNMTKVSRAAYEKHLNEVSACVWRVWNDAVTIAGDELPRPPVTIYTGPAKSPCGVLETHNAYYCTANQRIYFADDQYSDFSRGLRNQRLVWELVLAHEFGHHVQARTGILSSNTMLQNSVSKSQALEHNRRLELQADCFAGQWLGAVAASTKLTARDRANVEAAFRELGSPRPDPSDDHGSSKSRSSWALAGLKHTTISSCNTFVARSKQVN